MNFLKVKCRLTVYDTRIPIDRAETQKIQTSLCNLFQNFEFLSQQPNTLMLLTFNL